MPKGVEDMEKAIALCQEVAEGVKGATASSETEQIAGQLQEVISQLDSMRGKFFLKTNLSVRFTSSCLKGSEKLKEIQTAICGAKSGNNDWSPLTAELQELTKKVRLLSEKSTAEGDIVIT